MDAPRSDLAGLAHTAPLRIGAYGLVVRDVDRVADFYRDIVGLTLQERTRDAARLGADGVPLLELVQNPAALPDDRRTAGLHHTAFLMPTRADLARFLRHAQGVRLTFKRVSHHAVTEALYFDDPEGNEVECCVDTPRETWRWQDGQLEITSEPLDLAALAADDDGAPYAGAPRGLRIGHIHLRVGEVAAAERFYTDAIGFDVTCRRTGAAFLSSGRYHHHFAANIWQSAGAGPRDPRQAGLAWFTVEATDAGTFAATAGRLERSGAPLRSIAGGVETRDPWGTHVRLIAA
jgi:catechol 2,3-dioxygenase